jgi:hypothetical protein
MVPSLLIAVLAAAPVLPEHAVGGAFISRETKTELELTLRFDQSVVKDAPALPSGKAMLAFKPTVTVQNEVSLWDATGKLISLGKPAFSFRFTCENDGGLRAQAIAKVMVKKAQLPRALAPVKNAWNVVGFAVVGTAEPRPALTPKDQAVTIHLVADLDGDGAVDARLSGLQDEAMNCDEPEKKGPQWSVDLERETKSTPLRCCGP